MHDAQDDMCVSIVGPEQHCMRPADVCYSSQTPKIAKNRPKRRNLKVAPKLHLGMSRRFFAHVLLIPSEECSRDVCACVSCAIDSDVCTCIHLLLLLSPIRSFWSRNCHETQTIAAAPTDSGITICQYLQTLSSTVMPFITFPPQLQMFIATI